MDKDIFHTNRLLKALPNPALNIPNDGASMSLSNVLSLTNLIVEKLLPYIQSKSTSFQFKTIASCTVTLALVKSLSLILQAPLMKGHNKVSLEPYLIVYESISCENWVMQQCSAMSFWWNLAMSCDADESQWSTRICNGYSPFFLIHESISLI